MDEILSLVENLTKDAACKIKLDSDQKHILDSYVVAFMTLVNQEATLGRELMDKCLNNLDSRWDNLFEVTE